VIELQIVSGLVSAAILFLVASGLTLIFGVCHVLNLAHGAFFMLAGFLAFTITNRLADSPIGFWAALLGAPLVIAALGALAEITLFRRLYRADILLQVLPTIAIIYIISDAIRFFWGLQPLSVSVPSGLGAPIEIFGALFPSYYLVIVGVALAVALAMWWIVFRTDWGLLIRAISQDRDMAAALGVDANRIFTSVFALSMWLAGVGGVLYAPIGGANLGTDMDIVVEAFAVVVVGGLGSIGGSAVAALLIGMLKGFGILVYPQFALAFVFALMVLILIVRPTGLYGAKE
jgi:branched-subunit amino acid ABC-type transport system permease component